MKKLLTILGAVVMFAAGEAGAETQVTVTFAANGTPASLKLLPSSSNVAALPLVVSTADNKTVYFTSLSFGTVSGSTVQPPSEVYQVAVCIDNGVSPAAYGQFDNEAIIGTGTFVNGVATVDLTTFPSVAKNTNLYLLAVIGTTANTTVGHTFKLKWTGATVQAIQGATITVAPAEVTYTGDPMKFWGLTGGGGGSTEPDAGSFPTNTTRRRGVLAFSLTATGEPITVGQIALTKSGSAVLGTGTGKDVDQVSLYLDNGANIGRFDSTGTTDTHLETISGFSGNSITFSNLTGLSAIGDGNSANLIAVVRTTTTSTAGRTIALALESGAATGQGAADGYSSSGNAASASWIFAGADGYIQVASATSPIASGLLVNSAAETGKPVFRFKVTAMEQPITLTSITLTKTGSVVAPDEVGKVQLYIGGTAISDKVTLNNTTTVLSIYDIGATQLSASGSADIEARVDMTGNGVAGHTLTLTIAQDGHVQGKKTGTSNTVSSAGTVSANVFAFSQLTVATGSANPAAATLTTAVTTGVGRVVLQIKLGALGQEIKAKTTNTVTLSLTGTATLGATNDIQRIMVRTDPDGDGTANDGTEVYSAAPTGTLPTTFAFSPTTDITVPAFSSTNLLVTIYHRAVTGTTPANNGLTFAVSVAQGNVQGYGTDTPAVLESSSGTAASNNFTFQNAENTITASLSGTTPSGGPLYRNTNGKSVLQFKLLGPGSLAPAGNPPTPTLTGFTFTAGGTVEPSVEIAQVSLYKDVNGDGLLDEGDGAALAQGMFSDTTVAFTGLSLTVPVNATMSMIGVINTSGAGVAGSDFTLQLTTMTAVTNITATVQGTVISNSFRFPGTLTIEAANMPPASTWNLAGGKKAVLGFTLTAPTEAVNVTSVKLTTGGTAVLPTEIDQVFLYEDGVSDALGTYEGTERLVGSAQTAAGTVTITIPITPTTGYLQVAGSDGTKNLLAVVNTTTNAVNTHSFSMRIAAAADVAGTGVSSTGSVGTSMPEAVASNSFTFSDGATPILTVTTGPSTPTTNLLLTRNQTLTVLQIAASATNAAVTVGGASNYVKVNLGGTATFGASGEVLSASLFADEDNDGNADGAALNTQSVASSGVVTFSWTTPTVTINASATKSFLVKVTTTAADPGPKNGHTLTISVAEQGIAGGTGGAVKSSGTATSGTWAFPGLSVAVGENTPPATAFTTAATNRPILQIKLGAAGTTVTVNSIAVALSGTVSFGTGNDITDANIYLDTDGNGTADGSAIANAWTPTAAGTNTFTITSPFQITAGSFAYVIVTISHRAWTTGANDGKTVVASLADAAAAGTYPTDQPITSSGTATSNTFTFRNANNTVSVYLGSMTPAAGSISINQNDIAVLQIDLLGPGDKAGAVTGITFYNPGSGTGAALLPVRLYYDTNADGEFDGGDGYIKAASFSGANVTFSSMNIAVAQNGFVTLLAVLQTNGNGVSGTTFGLNIQTSEDVTTNGNIVQLGTAANAPVSNLKTLAQGQATVAATDIGAGVFDPTGGPNVPILDVTISVAGPAVALNSFTFTNAAAVGSEFTFDDIAAVRLYSDAGLTVPVSGAEVLFSSLTATVTLEGAPVYTRASDGTKHYYVGYRLKNQTPVANRRFHAQVTAVGITTNAGQLATTPPFPDVATDHSLPVEFASFTAEAVGQAVKLLWATESETDNLYWIVERKEASGADAAYVQIHRLDGMGSTPFRTDYEFVDRAVTPGMRYAYRLTDVSRYGVRKTHDPVEVTAGAALALALGAAYPNPANPATVWAYSLPGEQSVRLAVYNTLGQQVRVLVNGRVAAGTHQARWDVTDDTGRAMASGVYFAVMETPTSRLVSRVTVLR